MKRKSFLCTKSPDVNDACATCPYGKQHSLAAAMGTAPKDLCSGTSTATGQPTSPFSPPSPACSCVMRRTQLYVYNCLCCKLNEMKNRSRLKITLEKEKLYLTQITFLIQFPV